MSFTKVLGLGAAFDEVVDGALGRAETVGRLECVGRLDLRFARGNIFDDRGVDGDDIAAGRRWGFHHAIDDVAADEIFGGGDVLHAFSDGPAIRSGLEIPLRRERGPWWRRGHLSWWIRGIEAALSLSACVSSWARAEHSTDESCDEKLRLIGARERFIR